jgi:hypothetical protein
MCWRVLEFRIFINDKANMKKLGRTIHDGMLAIDTVRETQNVTEISSRQFLAGKLTQQHKMLFLQPFVN